MLISCKKLSDVCKLAQGSSQKPLYSKSTEIQISTLFILDNHLLVPAAKRKFVTQLAGPNVERDLFIEPTLRASFILYDELFVSCAE